MGIKYVDAIKKGFSFGFKPKRWLPFFVLNLIFLPIFTYFQVQTAQNPVLGLNPMFQVLFYITLIIFGLINLWIAGAIIHQSWKERDNIEKSFKISCNKFPSLLGVGIIELLCIGGAMGLGFLLVFGGMFTLGIGGAILAIIGVIIMLILIVLFVLIFFFTLQGVIVSKLGFVKAIKNSYNIFKKDKLRILAMLLLVGVFVWIITLIFSIPSFIYSFIFIFSLIAKAQADPALLLQLMQNSSLISAQLMQDPVYIITQIIGYIGSSIAAVFGLKVTTEFYLQIKKRFRFL